MADIQPSGPRLRLRRPAAPEAGRGLPSHRRPARADDSDPPLPAGPGCGLGPTGPRQDPGAGWGGAAGRCPPLRGPLRIVVPDPRRAALAHSAPAGPREASRRVAAPAQRSPSRIPLASPRAALGSGKGEEQEARAGPPCPHRRRGPGPAPYSARPGDPRRARGPRGPRSAAGVAPRPRRRPAAARQRVRPARLLRPRLAQRGQGRAQCVARRRRRTDHLHLSTAAAADLPTLLWENACVSWAPKGSAGGDAALQRNGGDARRRKGGQKQAGTARVEGFQVHEQLHRTPCPRVQRRAVVGLLRRPATETERKRGGKRKREEREGSV
jgi:hypothetical protein